MTRGPFGIAFFLVADTISPAAEAYATVAAGVLASITCNVIFIEGFYQLEVRG